MHNFVLLPLLVLLACLLAGLYGALHDQVSYSISPEYFSTFKFDQFEVPHHLRGRWGVAMVGWMASWWMGVFIGIPLGTVALILPERKAYLGHGMIACGVVMLTALAFAAVGQAERTTDEERGRYWVPASVTDVDAFHRVGKMHERSYQGGYTGLATGAAYLVTAGIVLRRRRQNLAGERESTSLPGAPA